LKLLQLIDFAPETISGARSFSTAKILEAISHGRHRQAFPFVVHDFIRIEVRGSMATTCS